MEDTKFDMRLNKLKKVFSVLSAYFIAIYLFVATGGAWLSDASIEIWAKEFRWWMFSGIILVVLFLILLNYQNKFYIEQDVMCKMLVFFVCSITYFYMFQGDWEEYFSFYLILIILFSIFLLQIDDIRLVWSAFINVVVISAVISLFFYCFGTLLPVIQETGRTAIEWGVWDTSSVRTFYNLYYEAQFVETSTGGMLPRNCGVFSEAPMYNFVLCTALGAELFVSKHTHMWKTIIIIFAIFSTLSTTGYIFIVAAVLLYVANIIFSQKGITVHKIAFLALTLMGFVIIVGIMFQKISSVSGAGSVNVRTDHLISCFKAWAESPIIGVGYQNQEAVLEFAKYKQGLSVGMAYLFATGGVLLGGALMIPYLMNGLWALKKRVYDEFFFETLFLILYFFTAVTTYPILRFFISYIIMFSCIKRDENRDDAFRERLIGILNANHYDIIEFKEYVLKKKKGLFWASGLTGIGSVFVFGLSRVTLLQVVIFGMLIGLGVFTFVIFLFYVCFIRKDKTKIRERNSHKIEKQ